MADDHLVGQAQEALALRKAQRAIFPNAVLRESCWDIMLLCFSKQLEGGQMCIKQIRTQLDESGTASLRRIDELEQAGMLLRQRDEVDARRTIVRLTRDGTAAMIRFFDIVDTTRA